MHNKRHQIIDDAWEMRSEDLGGSEHTMRVGLVVNTVINSIPVLIPDIRDLVVDPIEVEYDKIKQKFPMLINFKHNEMQVAILLVHDVDSGHIQCYPFSDIVDGKHWWLYEMAFDIAVDGRLEIRPVHPLVEYGDPTKEMIDHIEVLAIIVSSFITRLNKGEIILEEEKVDFSKINKKRIKNAKKRGVSSTPIMNNWVVKYVSEEND